MIQQELLVNRIQDNKEDYISELQDKIEAMRQSELKALADP